jgi:hypothetical protein
MEGSDPFVGRAFSIHEHQLLNSSTIRAIFGVDYQTESTGIVNPEFWLPWHLKETIRIGATEGREKENPST